MGFYGYEPGNFVPQYGGYVSAAQTMAGGLGKAVDKYRLDKERKELLAKVQADESTVQQIYQQNMQQETARLRSMGVQNPETVVMKFYLPKLATETPQQALERWAKADEQFDRYLKEKQAEVSLQQGQQDIRQMGEQNTEQSLGVMRQSMSPEQYQDKLAADPGMLAGPGAATPEQVQTVANTRNVPVEKFGGEMSAANAMRTKELVEGAPSGRGTTAAQVYGTMATSGKAITPEAEKYAKMYPTEAQQDRIRSQDARTMYQQARLAFDKWNALLRDAQLRDDDEQGIYKMMADVSAKIAQLKDDLHAAENPEKDALGVAPPKNYDRISDLQEQINSMERLQSDFQLLNKRIRSGGRTMREPLTEGTPVDVGPPAPTAPTQPPSSGTVSPTSKKFRIINVE